MRRFRLISNTALGACLIGLSVFFGARTPATAQAVGGAPGAPAVTAQEFIDQLNAERAALEARGASELEWLLFEGKLLKLGGEYGEAAEVYRKALTIDPNNLTARQELAHALFLARDFRAAKFHFETLEKADTDVARRGLYRRFLGLIDENQPFGVSGFFSIVPSSNVNRGTTNTVFDTTLGQFVINPVSQATSGVGVTLGASGYFRQVLSATRRVSLEWSLAGTRYEERQYNSTSATLGVSFQTLEDWGTWSVSPYVRRIWREDGADSDAIGLRLNGRRVLDARHAISGAVSHEVREYPTQSFQDGPFTSLSGAVERQISPSVGVSVGLGLERSVPEAAHLRYDGARIIAAGGVVWKGGLQTNGSLEFGIREFEGDYPLTTTPRSDDYLRLGFGVQSSRFTFQGFAPRLNCTHTANRSNVAFYDYDATDCQVSLSRNF